MHEQPLHPEIISEEQRVAGLHYRIAGFIDINPSAPEMAGAISQAQNGEFAAVSGIAGEFRLDNSDSRRTPLDNHFAVMRRRAGFHSVQSALRSVASFTGPTVTAEDFNNPDNTMRFDLLAQAATFAVENTADDNPDASSRTLWISTYDNATPDGSLTRLPLYRRVTGPAYYDNARPITLVMDYVIPPHLYIPQPANVQA